MKLTSLFCGALLALTPMGLTVRAQDATPSPSPSVAPEGQQPGGPGERHHGGLGKNQGRGGMMGERLAKDLNLTPDQQNQLKPVFEDTRTKVKAIREDSSLSQAQKRAKIKEIRQANRAKIEAVLTPEQKQKFESLRPLHGKGRAGGSESEQ